jgi:hypothetical protein
MGIVIPKFDKVCSFDSWVLFYFEEMYCIDHKSMNQHYNVELWVAICKFDDQRWLCFFYLRNKLVNHNLHVDPIFIFILVYDLDGIGKNVDCWFDVFKLAKPYVKRVWLVMYLWSCMVEPFTSVVHIIMWRLF